MAMNDMLAGALAHIGTSRTAEFRNQLKAIELATPGSIQSNVDYKGRGDG